MDENERFRALEAYRPTCSGASGAAFSCDSPAALHLFRAPKRFSGEKSGNPTAPALLFCRDLCAGSPLNTPNLRVFMSFCHLQRRPRAPCSSRPRAGLLRICPACSGCRAREWRLPRGPCGRILGENQCNVGENKCFFGHAAKGGAKQKPPWVFMWWRGT